MKISTLLKILPIIFMLTFIFAVFFFYQMYVSINYERDVYELQRKYIKLSVNFREVNDYLSEQISSYIRTHDKYHYLAYQEEINVLKTRENIINQLENMGSPKNEMGLITRVLQESKKLNEIEKTVSLLMDSNKNKMAESLFFSDLYKTQKEEVDQLLRQYQELMNARSYADSNIAKNEAVDAIILTIVISITNMLLLLLIFFILFYKMKVINAMLDIASQISKGNLNVNLEKYFSNDEFGLLAVNFGRMIGTIKSLILDIEHLTEQHDQGNLDITIDHTKYSGAYQSVSIGLMNMVSSYVSMINDVSRSLSDFSDGNFSSSMKVYPGDKATINIAIIGLKNNLTNISDEINQLISAASLGSLSKRANVDKFEGDWYEICLKLNKLLETIFEKLINNAPMAYLLTQNNEIIEANKYAIDNLGISLLEDPYLRYDDINDKYRLLSQLDTSGVVNGEIVKYITKNGSAKRYHVHISRIIHDGEYNNVIWAFDIEDHEQRNDAIKRARLNLNKLIEALPIPLQIIDYEKETVAYCNKAYLNLFEFEDPSEIVDYQIDSLFEPFQLNGESSLALHKKHTQTVLSRDSTFSWFFEYKTKTGQLINSKVIGEEILYRDKKSIVEIIQDVSLERKQHELLETVAEKEREANKLKSRFLANMSHEIRTPMNAIIGLSQVALLKSQSEENQSYFEKINHSSKNLLTIINDILDFSKIEAEKVELQENLFELEDVISNAFLVASQIVSGKPIEMLIDIDPDVPYQLYGDRIRLWQILKNFLDNAAKYTQKGRIELKVYLSDIEDENNLPNYDPEKTYLTFIIEDTGIGMNASQINKLFNLFERFYDEQNYETSSGTGLGMPISKGLIELMEGSIHVESKVDEGSIFTIQVGFKSLFNCITIKERIRKDELNGANILIIDDDLHSLNAMNALLSSIGAYVVCVSNSADALEKILQHKNKDDPFKIILLDYYLGKENGLIVARALKPYIDSQSRLLMISAYSTGLLKSDVLDAGFDDIIEKPFVPSTFIQMLCSTTNITKENYNKPNVKFKNAKVLLCEDNKINQDVANAILDMVGITPIIANNGQEAIILLEEQAFDLVFMDILMPVMDGHEAISSIRNSQREYCNIPIIAMSANAMKNEIDLCFSEGVNEYIEKPIDFDKLLNVLFHYLSHKIKHSPDVTLKEDFNLNIDENSSIEGVDIDDRPLIEIEGIDFKSGIYRFGGREDLYFSSLRTFAETTVNILISPDELSISEQLDEIKKVIHTLKGVSGNLSIELIYSLCVAFEDALTKGVVDSELYQSIFYECGQIKDRILFAIESMDDNTLLLDLEEGTDNGLMELLSKLYDALDNADIYLCEENIKELKNKRWLINEEEQLNKLYLHVNNYAFDEALKLTNDLINRISLSKAP